MENEVKLNNPYLYEGSIVKWSRIANMLFYIGMSHEEIYDFKHHREYSKDESKRMREAFRMAVDEQLIEEAEETAVSHLYQAHECSSNGEAYAVVIDRETGDSEDDCEFNALKRSAFADLRRVTYRLLDIEDSSETMEECIRRINETAEDTPANGKQK